MTKKKNSYRNKIISVITLVQNDSAIVKKMLNDIYSHLKKFKNYEFLVIDNGSSDDTSEIIRKLQKKLPQIRLIVLSREYDVETALTAGLDHCIGDSIICINSYTDPPEVISTIFEKLDEGYDIVFGRFSRDVYLKKNILLALLFKLINVVTKNDYFYSLNYNTGLTRKVVNAISRVKRRGRSFSHIYSYIGFRNCIISYLPHNNFPQKETKLSIMKALEKVLNDSLSSSYKPLRIALLAGVVASLLNLLFLLYVFIVSILKDNIAEGWITTSVIMGVMFFLCFLILTVISEYILRILKESQRDPLYFISDEYDSSFFQASKKDQLNVV